MTYVRFRDLLQTTNRMSQAATSLGCLRSVPAWWWWHSGLCQQLLPAWIWNNSWLMPHPSVFYVELLGAAVSHWQADLQHTLATHTHTHLTALFPGLPRWAGTRKVEPIWILLKQETVSGSGISWTICKCAPCSRQITTPAPHCSVFLQAGCPSCRPTNSVKALKAPTHPGNDQHTH